MQATDAPSFEEGSSTIDSGLPAAKRRKTTCQKEPVSAMDIDEDADQPEEPKASVQTLHGWYNKDGELYWRATRPQYRRKPDTSKFALILR